MKAGFIGTGSMGLPLASNILKQEKALVAYAINREATKSLADRQARIVESPVDVANEADIVFACMPTIQSFHAVVTAQNGLTLVPLRLYIKSHYAKIQLGLAKGRRQYDKRKVIIDREKEREAGRAMRRIARG